MKVRFKGMTEKRRGGCGACGAHRSNQTFTMKKLFILPSGEYRTFYAGTAVDVDDEDGEFLLNYEAFERA